MLPLTSTPSSITRLWSCVQRSRQTKYTSKSDVGLLGAHSGCHVLRQSSSLLNYFLLHSWWFQGLIFTGLWVVGHEVRAYITLCARSRDSHILIHKCGHGAFSPSKAVCDSIGFVSPFRLRFVVRQAILTKTSKVVHSFLWTPYFSWSIVHHRHHATHNSMERDEVYVPKTRSDLGIPNAPENGIHWHEYFEDTPIYTLFMLLRQQFFAFPAYLCKQQSHASNRCLTP